MPSRENILPASQDPYGDPADQTVLPASQDPYGDPADQSVLPASQDPYGDPADAARQHLAATDPADTQAYAARQMQGMAPGQANGLVGSLLNAVEQQGVNVNGILGQLGTDRSQAGGFLPQIVGMLHQNHPEELSQAVGQEPNLAGLIAHPSVGGVLGALASRFLGGSR